MRSRSKTIVSATLGVALAVGTGAPLYALADDSTDQYSDSTGAGYLSDGGSGADASSDSFSYDAGLTDSFAYDAGDMYVQDESYSYDTYAYDGAVDSGAYATVEDVAYDPFDLDGDGIPDMLDLDGDGIPDAEDLDHDGLPDDPSAVVYSSTGQSAQLVNGSASEQQITTSDASGELGQLTDSATGELAVASGESDASFQGQSQDGETVVEAGAVSDADAADGADVDENAGDDQNAGSEGSSSIDATEADDADDKDADDKDGKDAKGGKDADDKDGKDAKGADEKDAKDGKDGKDAKDAKDADSKDAKGAKDSDADAKDGDTKVASNADAKDSKDADAAKGKKVVAVPVNTSGSSGLVAAAIEQSASEADKTSATELKSIALSDVDSTHASLLENAPWLEMVEPNADSLTPDYEPVDSSSFSSLPSRSVNLTTAKFIATIGEQARIIAQENDLYASVLIAQAVIESGNGNSLLAQAPNNNLFGIKGSYKGKSAAMPTEEDDGSGNLYGIMAEFRRYDSRAESIADYADLLKSNPQWYAEAYKTNAATYVDACKALQGRYATSTTYAATLTSVIEAYDLTRYDKPLEYTVTGTIHDPDSEQSDKNGYRELTMDDYARLESLACSFLGTDYVWGGDSPATGFDCSGLVQWCMREAMGIELPRTTYAQQLVGKRVKVDPEELRMGDLLFFNTPGEGIGHVAMYLNDGFYIHAPETGDVVKVSSIEEFTPSFAMRVIDEVDLTSTSKVAAGSKDKADSKASAKSKAKSKAKSASKK